MHLPLNPLLSSLSLLLPLVLSSPSTFQSPLLPLPLASSPPPPIPFSTRAHWIRRANQALLDLRSPCPFEAFGTAIVNHTSPSSSSSSSSSLSTPHPLGDLICIGANAILSTGNPTLHGEIAGIANCTAILTDPHGKYKLSPENALAAFRDLTLYTNAEPCPMCAAAIRWAGFKECVYGTSSEGLRGLGWGQFTVKAREVFGRSAVVGGEVTQVVEGVLGNETDGFFAWQYRAEGRCPAGCERGGRGRCEEV